MPLTPTHDLGELNIGRLPSQTTDQSVARNDCAEMGSAGRRFPFDGRFLVLVVLSIVLITAGEAAFAKKPKGTVRYIPPGDSNSFEVHEVSRKKTLILEIFANSGPGASISNGSIAKKRASVETVAGYYGKDYGCDPPKSIAGIIDEKTVFDEARNTWIVAVKCK